MLTETKSWQRLSGKIAIEVLNAPKTCGDQLNQGEWPEVEEMVVGYLERNILGKPWANYLSLAALVMTARRRQANTVFNMLKTLSTRFEDLFSVLKINSMSEWNPTEVFRMYLRGEVLPDHSINKKCEFWTWYSSASTLLQRWLNSLPTDEQRAFQVFILPVPDRSQLHEVKKLRGDVQRQTKQNRKSATDAVVPQLPWIRANAQLRLNRLARLRQAYHDALNELKNGNPYILPFSYSYEEGEDKELGISPQERLYFRVWDRRTFVQAHQEHYSARSVNASINKTGAYSDDHNNRFFLEFVRTERLTDNAPPEGLWFEDLLQRGLLGNGPCGGTEEEIRIKQAYLRAWGHGDDNRPHALIYPFSSQMAGLLQWSLKDARFMNQAQRVAEGTLIPVEPLYAATMFGLLAVDIFTTTGMRINEAMQIRMTPECIKRVTQAAPPGAKDQAPRERVCLMLIPKGERADKPHPYYIGPEQIRLMRMTMKMLQNHYGLAEKGNIPEVDFHSLNRRSFRFKKKQPYLFQYNNRHLSELTIPACMKFLLHGMTFKNREGENVVVTAHLLRHAFATHAVQVLKVPKDIVREWLQQKDIEVTDYYSQPTESMISEHHDQLLMRFATHIDLGKRVVRMPEEQIKLYEEAKGKSGTLADVEGGHCVSHGFCAAKFACIGCAGKVVDPTKRYQVERKKQWAIMQLDFCQADGLLPEISRLEQLIRDCDAELTEMNLIEQYRKDGNRVAFIRIDEFSRRND